ncbi:rhizopine catabolism transcriptional regulator MocR [Labrys wisconsinensis]|uniref:GntR family transcriptional regulator/MocR family aminotransferase n=1 Tax=Labrys wisconsinensis TaxID=425677 RepID=A0ABU0JG60_9HYPH|nr:PLP-dependent aminotransferase family protein [Labrys wisconsinensis]MDQ0473268.1 GntR family transcriptional regulator/MocR family aminotransferase [Labrys wisconsinensis]
MRQAFALDALALDRTRGEPLHRQLYRALAALIAEHTLPAGSELPSTRDLAADLAIARNTVVAAYDQLATEGYLLSRAGARPVVVELPAGPAVQARAPAGSADRPLSRRGETMMRQPVHHGTPGQIAFHPGMPDARAFPFGVWSRLLARRAGFAGETLFGTYHVAGLPALREAIASYLRTGRGVRCTADQVVVTTGAQAAFDLLARLLLDPGDSVWVEEPGYFGAQSAFVAAGARLAGLTVGLEGWQLEPPPVTPRLIYVTPACQYPLGITMRVEQRLRLLEIAERCDAWVIEDDFDGEYRFQGRPVPAMQGSDRAGRVIYVGTFAKILFPALRLGYMVLPAALCARIPHALSTTGQFAPLLLQAALADFMNEGLMARHLKRMRRVYAERRLAFQAACEAQLAGRLTLLSGEAGIQVVGFFDQPLDDRRVAEAAQRLGVNVSPLSKHYRQGSPRHGLVLGYAACTAAETEQGMRKLREALDSASPDTASATA